MGVHSIRRASTRGCVPSPIEVYMRLSIPFRPEFLEIENGIRNLNEFIFWQIRYKDYYNYKVVFEHGAPHPSFNIVGNPICFIQTKKNECLLWEENGALRRCFLMSHKSTDNLPHIFLAKS